MFVCKYVCAAPRPSFSKTDSMSMQLLNVQIQAQAQGKGATSSKSKRAVSGRTTATAPANSGDSGAEQEVSEDEHHRHQHQQQHVGHKSVTAQAAASTRAARPMSYVDELAAGAVNTRRMSLLHNNNMHSHSIHNTYTNPNTHTHTDVSATALEHAQGGAFGAENDELDAELDLSGLNLSMKVPKRAAKAPVTMKIGNKFLSATVAGGKAVGPAGVSSGASYQQEAAVEPHRRGSRVNLVHTALPEHDELGMRVCACVGGLCMELAYDTLHYRMRYMLCEM